MTVKILLGTGREAIDEYIRGLPDVVVEWVGYREGIDLVAQNFRPDIAVISVFLPGHEDLGQVLDRLRLADVRVILLAGSTGMTDPLFRKALELGIYDILFNPITPERIRRAIEEPATYRQAKEQLQLADDPEEELNWAEGDGLVLAGPPQGSNGGKAVFPGVLGKVAESLRWAAEEVGGRLQGWMTPEAEGPVEIWEGWQKGQRPPAPQGLEPKVLVVSGVNRRVGATAFAVALAAYLSRRYPVEVVDAGGGAARWLRSASIPCRLAEAFSVTPGVVTIVDAGVRVPETVLPLAYGIYYVSDLSPALAEVQRGARNTFLIGSRGADARSLQAWANLQGVPLVCVLPEDKAVREGELQGIPVIPRSWKKRLARIPC